MRHQPTRDLYAYWNALRGERAAPERRDVDPKEVRGLLGDIFMLEAGSPAFYPFRQAGDRVTALFGKTLVNTNFLELWMDVERGQISSLCASVCDDTLPVVAGVTAAMSGQEWRSLELLLLPLRHHGKTHARILGTLSALPKENAAQAPGRLSLSLESMRMLSISGPSQRPEVRARAWMQRAADRLPASAVPGPVRQFAHLTVYPGGR